ncbi:hypothetical protein ACXR0O_06525 [Verrucomicrobiota bacterium sgz303538]
MHTVPPISSRVVMLPPAGRAAACILFRRWLSALRRTCALQGVPDQVCTLTCLVFVRLAVTELLLGGGKPTTANEGDPIVRLVMHQGPVPLLLVSVVYCVAILAFVSVLPRRPALIVLLLFTLWHYYGALTWLQFRFHYAYGGFLSGVVLAALLVAAGLDTRQTPAATDQHPQETA